MQRKMVYGGAALVIVALTATQADARGFGGYRGGYAYAGSRGGMATGSHYAHVGATPYGAGASAGHKGTYTGPNGTTVHYGAKGAAAAGPYRAGAAGAHGVKVTGPDGNTYEHGGAGAAGVGPNGAAAAGAHGTAVHGAEGNSYYHWGAAGGARYAPYSWYGGYRAAWGAPGAPVVVGGYPAPVYYDYGPAVVYDTGDPAPLAPPQAPSR